MDPDPAGFRVVGSGPDPDPAGTKMSRSSLDPDPAGSKISISGLDPDPAGPENCKSGAPLQTDRHLATARSALCNASRGKNRGFR